MYPEIEPDGGRPHRRSGTARAVFRNLLVVAVAAVVALLVSGFLRGDPRITSLFPALPGAEHSTEHEAPSTHAGKAPASQPGKATDVPKQAAKQGDDAPPPGLEEAGKPLLTPAKPATESGSYKFLATNPDGTPVGYSPCRPVHYVVNAELAPIGSEGLLEQAIANISAATGLKFINDGATKEKPSEKREAYQPKLYGERWAPILVSWTTPEVAPTLADKVIGTGGSTAYSFGSGPRSYVSGRLDLDTHQIAELLGMPGGSDYVLAVMQHELAHVVGLDHVDDPVQLMYPEIGAPDGLKDGDLTGLYKLHSAHCRKDL
ncbi:matrixin family metalloprotease [Arthrobacter sp. SW1]|uniref:matrixin family metalloprotease n=1 Tax=Arthrobacter sp. SW1 TaxID=1920889 RepID=UPI0009F4714C|nr:matrixin family metalloprotease [Arthrobacter sp. SW1]